MDMGVRRSRRSRRIDSHRRHMSERIFRSNRPGYPHPVCSELENSGIRVAVGDCSVTERRRWRPPYRTGKTVQTTNMTRTDARRRVARPWFRTAKPLGGTSLRELDYTPIVQFEFDHHRSQCNIHRMAIDV